VQVEGTHLNGERYFYGLFNGQCYQLVSTSRDQGVDWSKLGDRKSKRIGNKN